MEVFKIKVVLYLFGVILNFHIYCLVKIDYENRIKKKHFLICNTIFVSYTLRDLYLK